MAATDPAQQKRWALTQLGISAFIGLMATVVFQLNASAGQDILYWALLAIMLTSVAEVAWFLVKYLRLSRAPERS